MTGPGVMTPAARINEVYHQTRSVDAIGHFCWVPFHATPTELLWPMLETADEDGFRTAAQWMREELMRRHVREGWWPN